MYNAFKVVKDFEHAVADYCGAPYFVSTNSCSMALLLAVAWHLDKELVNAPLRPGVDELNGETYVGPAKTVRVRIGNWPRTVSIPNRTYISVPMSVIHAGGRPVFRDEDWTGTYQLKPYPIWDSARLFTSAMYRGGQFQCVSFHWNKTLGIQQGGGILHDSPAADIWFRRARFDGRTEGVAPIDDHFDMLGWHCYMSPEIAAEGLVRLSHLPRNNMPLPNDNYPNLAEMELFR